MLEINLKVKTTGTIIGSKSISSTHKNYRHFLMENNHISHGVRLLEVYLSKAEQILIDISNDPIDPGFLRAKISIDCINSQQSLHEIESKLEYFKHEVATPFTKTFKASKDLSEKKIGHYLVNGKDAWTDLSTRNREKLLIENKNVFDFFKKIYSKKSAIKSISFGDGEKLAIPQNNFATCIDEQKQECKNSIQGVPHSINDLTGVFKIRGDNEVDARYKKIEKSMLLDMQKANHETRFNLMWIEGKAYPLATLADNHADLFES